MSLKPFDRELICPSCRTQFVTEVSWDSASGECPSCSLGWFLADVYEEETGDAWDQVEWTLTRTTTEGV